MPNNTTDRLVVPTDDYTALVRAIASDESPVGIDAKKTHVVILHLLLDLQDRLGRVEKLLDESDS